MCFMFVCVIEQIYRTTFPLAFLGTQFRAELVRKYEPLSARAAAVVCKLRLALLPQTPCTALRPSTREHASLNVQVLHALVLLRAAVPNSA